jgi:tRNA pseudouridine55 synthase
MTNGVMQGILLVDKPKDWTSFDVVNYVRRMVATHEGKKPKNCKVGHTGTLDPQATGLLVLLVGKEYTRKATSLSKVDKTYEVTMKLGETSTTGDKEGEKIAVHHTAPPEKAVLEALESLQGHIMQVPPQFSAMKVNGVRAYKLARKGEKVVLEARPVTIYSNDLTSYDYPYVKFTSRVSSGTYIRSLVEDLGKLLETGAYMSDLRRTEVGRFKLENAVAVKGLSAETVTKLMLTAE